VNNYAFGLKVALPHMTRAGWPILIPQIPMTLHIIFRSGGLCVSMLTSYLIAGKRYSFGQVVDSNLPLWPRDTELIRPARRDSDHDRYRHGDVVIPVPPDPSYCVCHLGRFSNHSMGCFRVRRGYRCIVARSGPFGVPRAIPGGDI
jgi:hypothetical protein